MDGAMVTGRMDEQKKTAGNAVLAQHGMNASQAINLLYEKLIREKDVSFLFEDGWRPDPADWARAAAFVDSLSSAAETQFDELEKAEIKASRLAAKGLM